MNYWFQVFAYENHGPGEIRKVACHDETGCRLVPDIIFFLFNTKAQYSALKLLLVFNSTPGQVKLFLNYDKDMERPSTATLRNK